MNPNSVLSEELRVKKGLTGEETAVFKLVNAFKKEHDRDGNSVPEVYAFSPRITVTDPYFKGPDKKPRARQVTIGNVVTWETIDLPDGQSKTRPVTKPVEFVRGFFTCNAQKNETFEYLMRRPDNESNPFRAVMGGKTKAVKFKLVDDKKEISNVLMMEELIYQATVLVREMRDPLKLKALAEKLNKSPDANMHIRAYNSVTGNGDVSAIKLELIQRVKLYPKAILYAGGEAKDMVKVQVFEGINFGIIIFEAGSYFLLGKELEELFKPEPDKDKVESLIEYFMSEEGKEAYAKFATVLKTALKSVGSIVNSQ